MKCQQCNHEMVSREEDVAYRSLPNTVLSGVTVRRCTNCDYYEVDIPAIEDLHALLTAEVVKHPGRLTGAEARFLRKVVGWSCEDLANFMGIDLELVQQWERGEVPIGPTMDRALRLMALYERPIVNYSLHDMRWLGQDLVPHPPVRVQQCDNAWRAVG